MVLLLLLAGCTTTSPVAPQANNTGVTPVAQSTPVAANPTATPASAAMTPTTASSATATPAAQNTPTSAAGTPTTQSSQLSDSQLIAAIQKVVDQRSAALQSHNKSAFDATVDQHNNLAFRRLQNEDWDSGRAAAYTGGRVTDVKRTHDPAGYVKARVQTLGAASWWTFLQGDDGIWRMTEPRLGELGSFQSKEFQHTIVYYYPYDSDIVDTTGKLADAAYGVITKKMDREPPKKVKVYTSPTFESMPTSASREVLAFYMPGSKDSLYIRSLESYLGGTSRGGVSAETDLQQTIEHEMTHLIQDNIVPIVKLQDWMSEGLAQFNCNCWYGTLPGAIASDQLFTLQQLDQAGFFVRLDGKDQDASPDHIRQGYDEGRSLVEYINAKYGIEKYWDLVKDFAQTQDLHVSIKKVFNVDYDTFANDWLAWVRKTYAR